MPTISKMIALFTDFGVQGPYLGQMQGRLLAEAPGVPLCILQSDAPVMDPRAAAYLLAAVAGPMAVETVCVAVVDPGVGSERRALMLQANDHWFVGPDNGLLAVVAKRAEAARLWRIDWCPERLSASFHGRDLFAPVAARLAMGQTVAASELDVSDMVGSDWPLDLAEIIYIDHYGNAFSGLRADAVAPDAVLVVGSHRIRHARVFDMVPAGTPFWYQNSSGLVEIAVNRGRADRLLELRIGSSIRFTRTLP